MSVKTQATKRPRGKAYECACGEEKLSITREHPADAFASGWSYLWGECGGGVKLRFDGVKVIETRAVEVDEAKKIKALPVPHVDPYDAMLAELKDTQRARVNEIAAQLRRRGGELVAAGVDIGNLLIEANKLLAQTRRFGLFLERLNLDREKAFTAMRIAEVVKSLPAYFGTFQKIGQEKTALLMRLPEARRIEILDEGVPIDGRRVPITEVSFRPFNAVVRSIVGKSNRGRKPKDGDSAKKVDRFGLPADVADPLLDALKALHAFKDAIKHGLDNKHALAVGRLWQRIATQFFELHEDRGIGNLLERAKDASR